MEQTILKNNRLNVFNPLEHLYIGIDVHKDKHAAVGIDCFNKIIFSKEFDNKEQGFKGLIKDISQYHLKPIFGLEDSYGYGLRLGCYLFNHGYSVRIVSPVLVSNLRKNETHPEKSDFLDAFGVAKVMIQRIDSLPMFSLSNTDQIAKEIKELIIDREFLVKEQTRLKNQLHRLLHKSRLDYKDKFNNVFSLKALNYWYRYPVIKNNDSIVLKNQIRRKIKRMRDIKQEIKDISIELRVLVDKTGQRLETLNGCGLVLACCLIAEIRDINRFRSSSALAKYGGLCPRQHSSGQSVRYIKTLSGNRMLNRAIHRIALSQIGIAGNEKSRAYFAKKVSEGKTKAQALCCLKRRLVDIIYSMMKHKTEYRY